MADRRWTFSLLEDEESDDINVLVENLGKKIKAKKQMNSELEKEKPLAEIEKTSKNPFMEDNDGDDHELKLCWCFWRKMRSFIGRSKVDSTEYSDQDDDYDSDEEEESCVSVISSESEEEEAEENSDVEIGEEDIDENSKTGGNSKKVVRVFVRVLKLAVGGLCFLVLALFFFAIAMS